MRPEQLEPTHWMQASLSPKDCVGAGLGTSQESALGACLLGLLGGCRACRWMYSLQFSGSFAQVT